MRGDPAVPVGRLPLPTLALILLPIMTAGCALLGGRRAQPPPPPPPPPQVVVAPIHLQWEEPPRLIQMVTPIYPDSARVNGIEGQVMLQIVVDEQGFVTEAEVISSKPAGLFEEAAVSAVLQWVFEPARSGGHPIKVRMGQRMEFSLGDMRPPQPPPPPSAEKPPIIVREMMPPPIPKPGATPIFMAWETAPELIHMVTPDYPDSARQAGLEGKVILQIIIDEQGKVTEAEVILAQPPGVFEQAALAAVRQWIFEPARQRDKPIKVRMAHPIEFRLHQEPPPPPPPPRQPIFIAWETAPILIEAPDPVYPDSARQAGLEGMVIIQIVIDEQGKVTEAEVILAQPPGIFESAALEAVRKRRFEPALQREKPIKIRMTQTVVFRLHRNPPPPPPPDR